MPCLYAHTYFGLLAAQKLDPALLCPNFFLGCAGPDPYFYDPIPPTPFRRARVDLGKRLHRIGADRLFLAALDVQRPGDFPFLAGMLAHYCLDSAVHPYVHARQHEIGHTQMEVVIDMQLHAAHAAELLPLAHRQRGADLTAIDGCMARLVEALWGEDTRGVYRRSAKKFFLGHRLCDDPWGNKRRFFGALEQSLSLKKGLSGFFFSVGLSDERDFMNEAHRPWTTPGAIAARAESFGDLFNEGLNLFERALPLLKAGDRARLADLLGQSVMG